MEISKTTVGIVAAACITAGAAGAFLANRAATPASDAQTAPATADASSTAGVEQSEAVIADAPGACRRGPAGAGTARAQQRAGTLASTCDRAC